MKRQRRSWTPQQKAEAVLEILREEKTLTQLSQELDIAPTVLSRWKADFVAGMSSVFDKRGEEIERLKKEHEEEKESLERKIGELTMDVDWLKKKHKQVSDMRKRRT